MLKFFKNESYKLEDIDRSKVKVQKIQKLSRFLSKLDETRFNFEKTIYIKDNVLCGCAIGLCTEVFPDECKAKSLWVWDEMLTTLVDSKGNTCSYIDMGAKLFGLTANVSWALFTPGQAPKIHHRLPYLPTASPVEMSGLLDTFLLLLNQCSKN